MNSNLNLFDALENDDRLTEAARPVPTRRRQSGANAWARFGTRSKGPKSFNGVHRRGTKRGCA